MIAAARPIRFPLALAALLALALLAAFASKSAPSLAPPSDGGDEAAQSAYGKLPLSFVPNRGQVDSRARFHAQAPGLGVFFGDDKVTLALQNEKKGHALELRFPGANPDAAPEALDRRAGRVNYMTGSDRSQWQTNIPTYGAIRYRSLWPGIDLTFKGTPAELKYELTVHPGADPNDIRLAYAGASGLSTTRSGALNVATPLGALVDQRPKTFQRNGSRNSAVQSSYALYGNKTYGFRVGSYDRSRPLVIDPGLSYSTLLGGSSSEGDPAVAVDGAGRAYAAGATDSSNFPSTVGSYDVTLNGDFDVFVAKFNPQGSALLWSTFLGSSYADRSPSIAVDDLGRAYVAGQTGAPSGVNDFPTTPGAYDTGFNGGLSDGFLAELSSDGSSLLYSTFLGGSAFDAAHDIALGDDGSAYLSGVTVSTDFPATAGAYDTSYNGTTPPDDGDAFVAKLNPAGSALVYATYLGGSRLEFGLGIGVNDVGEAYVAGPTSSTNFPASPGAFDTGYNGGFYDIFVSKLNATGSALAYSTFLGSAGGGVDWAYEMAVQSTGSVVVVGYTEHATFPTTPGAYDTAYNGGTDGFVAKIHPEGSSLVYSTFLGGASSDDVRDVALDQDGTAYLTGQTSSAGFPVTAGAVDSTVGGVDAFVTRLNPAGSRVEYSTLLGGHSGGSDGFAQDWGGGIVVDDKGSIHVAGVASSSDFPTTPGAYDRTPNGFADLFVAKLAPLYEIPASASPLQFSLVPEFRQTISASQCQARGGIVSSHGSPLSFTSCNPPAFVPGTAARFRGTGNASLTVVEGDVSTPPDEADVAIVASLTDVRAAAGGDYAPDPTNPDLTLVARLRISDMHNGPGLRDPATVADLEFSTPVDCTTTPNPATGSTCSVSTTADAVNAGAILEGRSAVIQTFRVRVHDSGPNGVRGDSDDRRLASQGIYIP